MARVLLGTHRATGYQIERDGVPFDPQVPGSGFSWWSGDGGYSIPGDRKNCGPILKRLFVVAHQGFISRDFDWTAEGEAAAAACGCWIKAGAKVAAPKTGDTPSPFGKNRKARLKARRAREQAALRAVEAARLRMEAFEAAHGAKIDEIIRKDEVRRENRRKRDAARRARKATGQ